MTQRDYNFNREISIGDSGEDILELQRVLVGWGTKDFPIIIDGK
ncbi:hypothetical protein ACFL7D_11015 [candidate division KSB1 bacterium]